MSNISTQQNNIRLFTDLIAEEKLFHPLGIWGNSNRLFFYLSQLFRNIDLKDKTILDIGAGVGIFSLYMALNGAKKVISLEPELDGSHPKMVKIFQKLIDEFELENIKIKKKTFQEYKEEGQKFDLIFLHNSINHLHEEACQNLRTDPSSYTTYLKYYQRFHKMNTSKGKLLIADCTNRNLFGDLKLRNPLSPSIEWGKHAGPNTWSDIALEAGYNTTAINWTTLSHLGSIGKMLMANRFISYLTLSHFNVCFSK